MQQFLLWFRNSTERCSWTQLSSSKKDLEGLLLEQEKYLNLEQYF
jgi:hypothetical protein